jgi:hypothetical protein
LPAFPRAARLSQLSVALDLAIRLDAMQPLLRSVCPKDCGGGALARRLWRPLCDGAASVDRGHQRSRRTRPPSLCSLVSCEPPPSRARICGTNGSEHAHSPSSVDRGRRPSASAMSH